MYSFADGDFPSSVGATCDTGRSYGAKKTSSTRFYKQAAPTELLSKQPLRFDDDYRAWLYRIQRGESLRYQWFEIRVSVRFGP